jgi:hypothetical protein
MSAPFSTAHANALDEGAQGRLAYQYASDEQIGFRGNADCDAIRGAIAGDRAADMRAVLAPVKGWRSANSA